MQEEKGNFIEERIQTFEGVNSNIAPELIKETEARQLLNLRPEKLGKLSTRTGYQFGVYQRIKTEPRPANPVDPTITPYHPRNINTTYAPENAIHCQYPYNLGIYWIGEYLFETPWAEIDTDRVMVYAIICNTFDETLNEPTSTKSQKILDYLIENEYVVFDDDLRKYKVNTSNPAWQFGFNNIDEFRLPVQYLFVPLTGKYRNVILDNYFLMDITPDKRNSASKVANWDELPPNPGSYRYLDPFDWNKGKKFLRAPHRFWNTDLDVFNDLQIDVENWFLNNLVGYTSPTEFLRSCLNDGHVRIFGQASFYRQSLIISDPINGDQIIRDLYQLSDVNCDKLPHALLVQPNCLSRFDINIVRLDPRLKEGQENDVSKGVETGMALYGYVLPKKITKGVRDHADQYFQDLAFILAQKNPSAKEDEIKRMRELKVVSYMLRTPPATLLSAVTRGMYDATGGSWLPNIEVALLPWGLILLKNQERSSFFIHINQNYRRVFSNVQQQTEFVDLLGEVDFPEDTVYETKDEGKLVTKKEKSADVYIWEDFKLTYYPVVFGSTRDNVIYPYLLREADRPYHKTTPKTPRLLNLNNKKNAGKYAPLGVWNYRFVWDFGNGIYSAPSTVLTAPDFMWSAITDNDLPGSLTRPVKYYDAPKNRWDNATNKWKSPRPHNFTSNFLPSNLLLVGFQGVKRIQVQTIDDSYAQALPWIDYLMQDAYTQLPVYRQIRFNYNDGNPYFSCSLTKYGELLWRLKHKLYKDIQGRYSNVSKHQGFNEDTNADIVLRKGTAFIDFPVLITAYFGDEVAILDGIAWQFVKLDFESYGNEARMPTVFDVNFGNIYIPLFQKEGIGRSRFSLFDDDNRLRIHILQRDQHELNGVLYNKSIGQVYWAAPWRTQPNFRGDGDRVGDTLTTQTFTRLYDIVLSRDPFEEWMNLYLLLYSNIDFNNLPASKFFYDNSRPPEAQNSIYYGGYSRNYWKNTINPSSYYLWYLYRPTNFVRGLRSEVDLNSLAIVGREIPNEAYERLVKSGTIELQLVYPDEYISPWYLMQQIYGVINWQHKPGYVNGLAWQYYPGVGPVSFASDSKQDARYVSSQDWLYSELIYAFEYMYSSPDHWSVLRRFRNGKIFNLREYTEYYNEDVYVTHVRNVISQMGVDIYFIDRDIVINRPMFAFTVRGGMPAVLISDGKWSESNWIANTAETIISYASQNQMAFYVGRGFASFGPPFDNNWLTWFLANVNNINVAQGTTKGFLRNACFHNIEVYLYGQGHRLLAPEQLTAHFPSSLLFKAPRLGLHIDKQNIPRLAKKLLVFRTLSTLNNSYDPNNFGLVKEIEILRDENGEPYTIRKNENGDIEKYEGVYFFDDVQEEKVDFSISPIDFEGLKTPLYSRFHTTLNERTYYYNFVERYRPETLRENETNGKFQDLGVDNHPNTSNQVQQYYNNGIIPSSNAYVYVSTNNEGFKVNGDYEIYYAYSAEDDLGKIGEPQQLKVTFTVQNDVKVVVLSLVPIVYDASVKRVKIYRKIVKYAGEIRNNSEFYLIGEMTPSDEGIFVDTDLPEKGNMPCWDFDFQYYPTGLRWSEPYRPDWIKLESQWAEYKAGKNGTGLAQNYGNLVLYTDTSCARYTVQAQDPPLSRVDELSPNIGCVAPLSLIDYNNTLFFLSWQGWTYFDNNIFKPIDDKFAHEIAHLLTHKHNIWEIAQSTGGIHQNTNELYLNLPMMLSGKFGEVYIPYIFDAQYYDNRVIPSIWLLQKYYYEWGDLMRFDKRQKTWGNVFVNNLIYQYSTKFGYLGTTLYPVPQRTSNAIHFHKVVFSPLGNVRMYFTNSLGELRSAEIFPNKYRDLRTSPIDWYWASMFIESIYPTSLGIDYPLYTSYRYNQATQQWEEEWSIIKELDEDVVPVVPKLYRIILFTRPSRLEFVDFTNYAFDYFPKPYYLPVRWLYFSKFFNAQDETGVKRLRKVDINIYNRGPIFVRTVVLHREEEINYLEEYNLSKPTQNTFQFNPVNLYYYADYRIAFAPRNQSVLSMVPNPIPNIPRNQTFIDDWNAKPLKHSIEIYGIKRATISEIGFYFRPIHRFLM